MRIVVFALFLLPFVLQAQFSPDGGQAGSIAIHADSATWKFFAAEAVLELGWLDAADPSLGKIGVVQRDATLGPPDLDAQPLGDQGTIRLEFERTFEDIQGYDFVVFENGFATSDTSGFFELAFVEVSSDGQNYVRFPAISLHDPVEYTGSFVELDSRKISGLAGGFSAPYGTPFDLADLPINPNLDLNNIRYIRLIDVIGTANTSVGSLDSRGNVIVDPYPTAFDNGGFDLDAVGILSLSTSNTFSSFNKPLIQRSNQIRLVPKNRLVAFANEHTIWYDSNGRFYKKGPIAPVSCGFYVAVNPYEKMSISVKIY